MLSKTQRKQIALRAAEIVRNGWCKNALARDKDGNRVGYKSEEACSFCGMGAIYKASIEMNVDGNKAFERINEMFGKKHKDGSIAYFNDRVAKDAEDMAKALEEVATMN